ncbi:hypothetical protein PHYBOEH_001550 [Phytophthora boehmeriae]|uniref:Uncharacterized protein n=1 Tax=Phytophthora boehmeriae TaxID=109152 RepID=A0A8T1WTW3_9STRA|nr:hypothetical protein PHYBOEH_001550 [Phytophthora boehmeriae]
MAKQRFQTSPYHDLTLTLKDRRMLMELESEMVEDTFRKYETYVMENCSVNEARWKHVKSKDDLHIYVKRTERIQSIGSTLCGLFKRRSSATASDKMLIVLSVGTFKGKLDDLMLGTLNYTRDLMHVKASYVGDYDDGAVLATLATPTTEQPFRSLSVKWFQIDLPFSSTGLVRNRDFICLEASGFLHFANGDRVGYFMLHSIDSPQTQPLPNVERARHTMTGFFHQVGPDVIDTFCFDTVSPGGNIYRPFVLTICANALLSATNYVNCGHMMKLTWMLQRRQAALRLRGNSSQRSSVDGTCVACAGDLATGTGVIGKGTCKLCMGGLCVGCKVVKTISFIAPGGRLVRHKTTFCARCVRETIMMNAEQAARDQAEGFKAYNMF